MSNKNYLELVEALHAAKAAAKEAITEDGGTCNFDQPLINLKGWKETDVALVNEAFGTQIIGNKMQHSIYNGFRPVNVDLQGQANCRTRMAEAARNAVMYYQMD